MPSGPDPARAPAAQAARSGGAAAAGGAGAEIAVGDRGA